MSITLKQLAELSGVSIRTVNRALKGQGHVCAGKQKQILDLARKYNYIPNMAARNLRLNRSKFAGILCSNLYHEIFVHKLTDLEQRLRDKGFYPVVGCYDGIPESLEKMFAEWSGIVDFVVVNLFACQFKKPSLPELFANYPLIPIYVDQEIAFPGHCLNIDRTTGIRDAIMTLITEKKKRILRCGSLSSREKGLQAAFEATPPKMRPQLLRFPAEDSFEAGHDMAPSIMNSGADAVFFDTDRAALGFLNYAAEHHIAVPDRIAVIGFDDDRSGSMVYPTLSTVAHPVGELNSAIVEIIENKPADEIRRTFPTRFIRRMSC